MILLADFETALQRSAQSDPDILYNDDAIAVCLKPAGVDAQIAMPSMLSAQLGGEAFCVHRLDRDVGGLMVYARTSDAAAALSRLIGEGRMNKDYLAVCAGIPAETEGELRDLLFLHCARFQSVLRHGGRRHVPQIHEKGG